MSIYSTLKELYLKFRQAISLLSATLTDFSFHPRAQDFNCWWATGNFVAYTRTIPRRTMILPSQQLQISLRQPLSERPVSGQPDADYKPSFINPATQALTWDSRCTVEAKVNRYDPQGNVLEAQKPDDIPVSHIYDSATGVLQARVTQAGNNQIAYESFENGVANNRYWTFAPATGAPTPVAPVSYTGRKGY